MTVHYHLVFVKLGHMQLFTSHHYTPVNWTGWNSMC